MAILASFYEFHVLVWGVDAGTGMFDLGDEYIEAIFNGTQLFEFFDFFQRGLRHFGNFQQEVLAIGIYSEMAKMVFNDTYTAGNPVIRNHRPRKVNCLAAISFEF